MPFTPWPHQLTGVTDVLARFRAGIRRVCLTTPTGGGKTWMIERLAREHLEHGLKVVLYSSRRLLIKQISRDMEKAGLEHGVRAASYRDQREKNFQISSLATETARSPEAVFRRARKQGASREEAQQEAAIQADRWQLHDADLVIVDEAHLHVKGAARGILDEHNKAGAYIVGPTATPIGVHDMYDELVVAGNMTSLRACGALIPIRVYGPDEPDLRGLKGLVAGRDLSENQIASILGKGKILFGRVYENWQALNPDARPTILFASGVEESLWFAEEFSKHGIAAAHIDGEHVWRTGWSRPLPTTAELRDEILEDSKYGRIKVLTNRYVFREGIDAPWLYHGILATVIGSLQSYLQCVGRLPRAHPTMDHVILQDHGGHWWRHGSPNADRHWDLRYTNNIIANLRQDRIRNGDEQEPWRCPHCKAIMAVRTCPYCGYVFDPTKRSRPVVQADGTLKEIEGPIFKPRKLYTAPDAAEQWKQVYFRFRNSRLTFHQAINYFASLHYWRYPSRTLPFMPINDFDVFRRVKDVETSQLIDWRSER